MKVKSLMKAKILLVILALLTVFFVGCAGQEEEPPQTTPPETEPDVVTTASIVDNAADFEKAISGTGTWLIAIVQDIEIDKDIVLDGKFTNGKKDEEGNDIIQRKVALYSQDDDRNITDRYTLTAPRFTINSPQASIQHGTFKGDLYVSAENFELVDTTVDGNVYFTNEEAESTFEMDDESEITGEQKLKEGEDEEEEE